jgi:hypothetical protein
MPEQKTKPTTASVDAFLSRIADAQQREDAWKIAKIMQEITGKRPTMWGPSMVGFGQFHYVYGSGHEGDTFLIGLAPRKGALVLYFCAGLDQRFATHLKKLGKVKTGKGCMYIKKLADVDVAILREMIRANVEYLAEMVKAKAAPAQAKKTRKKK